MRHSYLIKKKFEDSSNNKNKMGLLNIYEYKFYTTELLFVILVLVKQI